MKKFTDFETISQLDNPDMILNQLETEILIKLTERYIDNERIKFFVHDKDAKSYKLIHEIWGWKIEERADFTHTTKSWKNIFEARKMLALDEKKVNEGTWFSWNIIIKMFSCFTWIVWNFWWKKS